MADGADSDTDVRRILKLLAVVAIGIIVLAPIFQIGLGLAGSHVQIHPVESNPATVTGNDIPDGVTVAATTGQTAAYNGHGSHTTFDASLNTSRTWTATVAVKLAPDASTAATYTLLGYQHDEFSLHYSNGSYLGHVAIDNQSATTTIPAPNPRTWTVVGIHYNADNDTANLVRATTRSTPVALTNASASRPVSQALNGRLDELRLFHDRLTDSQLSRYSATPAASLPQANRVARIMWDVDTTGTPRVWFTGTTASVIGGTLGNGIPQPGLVQGQDYQLLSDPFRVQTLDGGLIDEAPVAFVSWGGPLGHFFNSLVSLGNAALTLLIVAALGVAGRRALNPW